MMFPIFTKPRQTFAILLKKILDVSQSNHDTAIYPHAVLIGRNVIFNKLTHLDISCINLATQPSSHVNSPRYRESVRTDICGLLSSVQPLEYLGLFNCKGHVHEIPAE